jgi:NAD(P)-dependent dehydrogenase (short-subunit alcohol dehydrogenase family)
MVEALLDAGHRVVAVSRSGASDLAPSDRLLVVRGDVASADDAETVVARTIAHFGALDALVNNAGLNLPTAAKTPDGVRARRFYDVGLDEWHAIMRVNVDGPFHMARAATPHLVARGWGRIVNHVTSFRTMVRAGEAPYGPSKAALEAMTTIWAAELKDSGVTVNAILPGGASDTRMIARDIVPDRTKLIPPSVMAAPIRFLLSDAADGVTARRITAALWKPGASDADNLAAAAAPAGWAETVAAYPAPPWPPR